MNNDNFRNSKSWEFVDEIITDFPNLTLTAIPLKIIKANYFLYNDSVGEGMKLIDEVIKEKSNPYIMLPEVIKAKYYNALGDTDSSTFYAKKAFYGLPKNPFHFAELSKSLIQKGQVDSVVTYFKKIRNPYQADIYRLFMAALLPNIESLDVETKNFVDEVALEGIKLSANNKEEYNNLLRLTAFMILHGRDAVQQMLDLESTGAELLNSNKWLEALEIYNRLDKIISTNYIFKENIALASFNIKDYDKVIKITNEIEELNHILNESQQFMLGISLWQTDLKGVGCERIGIASKMGLEEAKNALKILCNL